MVRKCLNISFMPYSYTNFHYNIDEYSKVNKSGDNTVITHSNDCTAFEKFYQNLPDLLISITKSLSLFTITVLPEARP